ncbi:MAG: hypothetical protein J1F24_05695 [Oscillospiraceae bacterium]|nr:hypothetical protein [Oscillospiraceae bacterium]
MKKVLSVLLIIVLISTFSSCTNKPDTQVDSKMEYAEFEWPDSEIAKLIPVPKSNIGYIYWAEDYGFVIYVANTTADDYAEYVKACEESGFTIDGRKGDDFFWADNENGYQVTVRLQEDDVMFIRMDDPEDEFLDDSTEDLETESVPEQTDSSVESVSDQSGESNDISTEASTTKPPQSLYYSTNTLEQAKEGNLGIYSYKRSGSNYDLYWIIDFDEGCAYYFTYGNNNGICDRVMIDNGNLNSYVTVTYHDGDSSWQYGLCFKRVRQPDRLIQSESNGTQYEFIATDLNDALKIRDSMKIVNY